MARTKASVGAKVSSGKSSKARCSAAPPPSSSSSSGSSRSAHSGGGGGGNSVCPQPTPKWQRPITNFFISKEPVSPSNDENGEGTSRPKKRNVIESDEEEVPETTPQPETEPVEDRPRNSVLDESIELAPLRGEDSHKIEEYYSKNGETLHQNGEIEESQNNNEENTPKNSAKGKGRGKKTNKENISANIENERRKSVKRDRREEEEDLEDNDQVSKKVKVN